tara:strand:- start:1113 stop:2135 length:1023 start_codon:yes stop_codon:yes gene_type:complete
MPSKKVKKIKPSVKKVNSRKPSIKKVHKSNSSKGEIKELILQKIINDEEIEKKEGHYFSDKYFPIILKEDYNVFNLVNGKKTLIAKFRKNVISKSLTEKAIQNLKEVSKKKHYNRGSAAGLINMKKIPNYVKKKNIIIKNNYSIEGYNSNKSGNFVNQGLSNESRSNIIGFFDKRDRNTSTSNLPCRLTAFNHKHIDKFKNVEPFLERIDELFKKLVPNAYKRQYNRAHETKFVISNTSFSTVTINNNWRTALHKDSGDFYEGFGNLVVCEKGKYAGGYTGFPQYGVAFDVRNGDFLAMDVHQWHCNTPIKPKTKDYIRMSVVCYLRSNMLRCKGLEPSY